MSKDKELQVKTYYDRSTKLFEEMKQNLQNDPFTKTLADKHLNDEALNNISKSTPNYLIDKLNPSELGNYMREAALKNVIAEAQNSPGITQGQIKYLNAVDAVLKKDNERNQNVKDYKLQMSALQDNPNDVKEVQNISNQYQEKSRTEVEKLVFTAKEALTNSGLETRRTNPVKGMDAQQKWPVNPFLPRQDNELKVEKPGFPPLKSQGPTITTQQKNDAFIPHQSNNQSLAPNQVQNIPGLQQQNQADMQELTGLIKEISAAAKNDPQIADIGRRYLIQNKYDQMKPDPNFALDPASRNTQSIAMAIQEMSRDAQNNKNLSQSQKLLLQKAGENAAIINDRSREANNFEKVQQYYLPQLGNKTLANQEQLQNEYNQKYIKHEEFTKKNHAALINVQQEFGNIKSATEQKNSISKPHSAKPIVSQKSLAFARKFKSMMQNILPSKPKSETQKSFEQARKNSTKRSH